LNVIAIVEQHSVTSVGDDMVNLLRNFPNAIAKALCTPWMLSELIEPHPLPLVCAVEAVILRPVLVVCPVALLDTLLLLRRMQRHMFVAVPAGGQRVATNVVAWTADLHEYPRSCFNFTTMFQPAFIGAFLGQQYYQEARHNALQHRIP
jgi:hypothetical protein